MVHTSRLLKSAFIIPLSMSLAVTSAWGFELTGDSDDVVVTDTIVTSAPQNDDDEAITEAQSILIEGSPTGTGNAALLVDDDTAVTLDGMIRIRDYEDSVNSPITDAIGLDIANDVTDAAGIRLKSGGDIFIIEIRGPEYDADDDDFADNDSDEDGIGEGSQALAGDNTRIGLRLQAGNTLTGPLIGETDSLINIEGNAANIGDVAGVRIDGTLSSNLDLSTFIDVRGDNGRGVDINGAITGYYRQRGTIDVRGENSVGIDVGSTITGTLMIESLVNATGYSTAPTPTRGADESDLTADEQTANAEERRRSGSAVDISADITGGMIIGGVMNSRLTPDEDDEVDAFKARRSDGDQDNDITDLKTDPYHFDENRALGSITTYGEADGEAALKITANIGSANGATREVLLDTANDDDEEEEDFYNSTGEFFYSFGLMNRGTIAANSWYDAVKSGSYQIDTKATGVLLNGTSATIHGGIYNSGSISATAYNSNAIALDIADITLNDGQRSDDVMLQNEGTISATIATHTGSHDTVSKSSNSAVAVKLAADNSVTLNNTGGGVPVFVNMSLVSAQSTHRHDDDGDDDYESVSGDNAIAFDFSAYNGNVNITQELLKADALLNPNAANSAANPYRGGGDTDIDLNEDGVIDTRDVISSINRIPKPEIIGDVKFGDGNNVFTAKAGDVTGDISFGGGTDALILSNEIADDDDDDYTAPATEMVGRITKGSGALDVTIGDRSVLHLEGQEGDADNETEGLEIRDLTLQGSGNLKFTVDASQLSDEVIHVTNDLTLADDARLTPALKSLFLANETKSVKLISYDNPVTKNNAIDTYLADETPFIYDVSLRDESNAIFADFSIKSANDLGLNKTEDAALNAVISHFNNDDLREQRLTALDDGDNFRAAYRQLLPHYSDGTAQQLSGLADMATGAVSQHLQLINAGGRRGGDGWVQQFGDYRKQDASANGAAVSGTSYAIALGYDLPASMIDALGLYLQMGFSAVNEKSAGTNEVTSESIAYGAYLSDQIGPLHFQLNAAYGFVDLESERLLNFSGLVDQTGASWDATSTAASARLAYPILQNEHVLRLEAGLDFFRLDHDDYSESEIVGRGFAMQVKGGASEKTSQFIGLRGGYRRGGGDPAAVVWEPNYYLGWRTTSDISPYRATTNFVGSDESFTLQSHIEPEDALDIGLGFAAHNDYFAFEFNYRTRIADDEETHGGGVSIRLLF